MNQPNSNHWMLALLIAAGMAAQSYADGNVTVEVTNGNLQLTGQNNTNQSILISATGNMHNFRLRSLDNTRFNGSATLLVTGITGHVQIDMKSGRKILGILDNIGPWQPRISGNLKITSMGNSDVFIYLVNLHVAGNTHIDTRGGDDVVMVVGGHYSGRFRAKTGKGNDVVTTDSNAYFYQNFEAFTGNGNDYVIMWYGYVYGFTDIRLGGQDDNFGATMSGFAALSIQGNGGFDRVSQWDNFFGTAAILGSLEQLETPFQVMMAGAVNETSSSLANEIFFAYML